MASPPLHGSAEWSAKREAELLLLLTRGNYYAAQQLWLRRERIKAEASQAASAGPPQASQRAAGCQAKPTAAKARDVPKPKRKKSAARLAKDRKRLNHKRLASKVWAFVRVARKLIAWSRRARANLEQRMDFTPPVTPTRPSVTVTESAAALCTPLRFPQPEGLFTSITVLPFYQDKSFEELRWAVSYTHLTLPTKA